MLAGDETKILPLLAFRLCLHGALISAQAKIDSLKDSTVFGLALEITLFHGLNFRRQRDQRSENIFMEISLRTHGELFHSVPRQQPEAPSGNDLFSSSNVPKLFRVN
jgi:hypothetical protein